MTHVTLTALTGLPDGTQTVDLKPRCGFWRGLTQTKHQASPVKLSVYDQKVFICDAETFSTNAVYDEKIHLPV